MKPNELMRAAWSARAEGKLTDAERLLGEALSVAKQSDSPGVRVQCLVKISHVMQDQGRAREAGEAAREAVSAARTLHDPRLLAWAVRHLGDVCRADGQLGDAAARYREAISLYAELPEPPPLDVANALRPLAIVMESEGDTARASELWEEARRLYGLVGIQEGVDEASAHLAAL